MTLVPSAREGSAAPMKRPPSSDVRCLLPDAAVPLLDRVVEAADREDASVYLVGGPVRDWLMGRAIRDIDLLVANADLFTNRYQFIMIYGVISIPRFILQTNSDYVRYLITAVATLRFDLGRCCFFLFGLAFNGVRSLVFGLRLGCHSLLPSLWDNCWVQGSIEINRTHLITLTT